MRDYKKYAMVLTPIEEKDLILFNISTEEKSHVVKQFNRALVNSQRDGSDVAQIILKSLIAQYPQWGDCALLFGICLASEGQYKRAFSALEYAVNNSLRSQQYLAVAQDAMKAVKEDMENPPQKPDTARAGKNWTSVVAENNGTNERVGMHAPILVKASAKPEKMGMASDRERRDIMMRSASGGDEMAGDDIDIENVRTPADNLRLTIRIIAVIVAAALIFVLARFVILPLVAKVRNSADTERRLDYILTALEENSGDPEVANILKAYGEEFSGGSVTTADTAATAAASGSEGSATDAAEETAAQTEGEITEDTASITLDPETQPEAVTEAAGEAQVQTEDNAGETSAQEE